MKAKAFVSALCGLAALLFVNIISYSQNISEVEIFTLSGEETADPWSLIYDEHTGKYAYVKYDALYNLYSVVYDVKESGKYGYISSYDIKFDSQGNYYILATEYTDPDNYIYDYVLLVNGDSITSFRYAEPYNAMMTKNDEYKFTIRTGGDENAKSKIITYSVSGGLSESEEYLFAKPVYSGTYPPIEGDADAPYANFFKDKEGNTGFIVSDGISASIIFGDNVIKTDYYDIEASSFVYDKNGELTYVAKNGAQFYTAPGNEFVVQGSKRHAAFDNVYIPVQFNSKNEPVYTGAEFLADIINNYFLVIGSEKQPVYKDAAKKERGEEFNGGLYEIKIDASDNISYYGSIYEEMMDSREGGFVKTSYVVNNVRGKFYYGLGLWKFYGSEALNTFNPNKDYYTTALIHRKAGKDNVLDEKYGSIPDYGFNNAGKIYYVGLKEGDYDKKVKPEYFVYIDGLLAGKYETILFEGIGDNYNMILFDSRDNYAYAVSTFNYYEEGDEIVENSSYVITNKGKQDPQILSGDAKKDFDYIESMFYTANDRLFYIGGINDYPANKYYSEIIVDGQNLGKVYTGVSNFRYDKEANTVSFYGARGNTLYKVNVSF